MAVKEVKRTDTGKAYRSTIPITLFFLMALYFVFFYLSPGFVIFTKGGPEGFLNIFALLLPITVLIFVLFGFLIYRHSTHWMVLCHMENAEKYRDLNVEKMVERLRQRFSGRFNLVDSVDRYDKWFQMSGGEKLLSDNFVIYVHGSVNNNGILTIHVNFRVMDEDRNKIESLKKGIEEVLEGYEPVKSSSSL